MLCCSVLHFVAFHLIVCKTSSCFILGIVSFHPGICVISITSCQLLCFILPSLSFYLAMNNWLHLAIRFGSSCHRIISFHLATSFYCAMNNWVSSCHMFHFFMPQTTDFHLTICDGSLLICFDALVLVFCLRFSPSICSLFPQLSVCVYKGSC